MKRKQGINAKAWFYGTSFHNNSSAVPPSVPVPEVVSSITGEALNGSPVSDDIEDDYGKAVDAAWDDIRFQEWEASR
jgi:hypothetical protein